MFLLQHEGEGDVDVLGAAAVVGPGHRGHGQRGVGEAGRVAAHRHRGLVDVPGEGGGGSAAQHAAANVDLVPGRGGQRRRGGAEDGGTPGYRYN